MALGLAALLSPSSADVLSALRVVDVKGQDFDFNLGAAAVAAARLAQAATDCVFVPCQADASLSRAVGGAGSSWGGGACPLGYGSSSLKLKVYPRVTVPCTFSLLTPHKLMWLFLKNTGLVFLLQTNIWLYQALDAEEQALQQGTQAQLPPYPDVLGQLVKACWNSLRELVTALTRSEIKHAINRRASSKLAWKILKDPRESLTRKALFYFNTPSWQLLPMYTKTMLRTSLPMYAAEFIVACVYDAADELRRLLQHQQQQQPGHFPSHAGERLVGSECLVHPEQEQRGLQQLQVQLQQLLTGKLHVPSVELQASSKRWVLRAGKNLLRVTGTAVCAAAGAGVAGSVAPRERTGVWAVRGHIVSDLLFCNVLLLLLDGGFAMAFGPGADEEQRHGPRHFGLTT